MHLLLELISGAKKRKMVYDAISIESRFNRQQVAAQNCWPTCNSSFSATFDFQQTQQILKCKGNRREEKRREANTNTTTYRQLDYAKWQKNIPCCSFSSPLSVFLSVGYINIKVHHLRRFLSPSVSLCLPVPVCLWRREDIVMFSFSFSFSFPHSNGEGPLSAFVAQYKFNLALTVGGNSNYQKRCRPSSLTLSLSLSSAQWIFK